jgi:FkbM family methyltransferase
VPGLFRHHPLKLGTPRMRNLLAKAAIRIANALGDRQTYSTLNGFFFTLKRAGFHPSLIYDVGANRGQWMRVAHSAFPQARIVCFEPQAHLHRRTRNVEWRAIGLSNEEGEASFTMLEDEVSSNFRTSPQAAERRGLRQVTVPISTIDRQLAGAIPDLVKIDAEGLDMEVLEGASTTFGKTDVFIVETGILSDVENDLRTVCDFMAARGYRLAQIVGVNNAIKSHLLFLADLAFIRADSPLLADCDSFA